MKNSRKMWVTELIVGVVAASALVWAADEKPKYTVSEIMKVINKGDDAIVKRATAGTASKEETAKILDYYRSLPLNEAPKGEASSWKEKTAALVKAAENLHKGKEGAVDEFKKAVNCKACHSAHKPD